MTLGEIIKNYRILNDLSMQAFADKSKISKQYISLLEKNQHPATGKTITPSVMVISQAAAAMQMDFSSLITLLDGDGSLSASVMRERSELANAETMDWALSELSEEAEVPGQVGTLALNRAAWATVPADFCMIAKDDSMCTARIHPNDILFIKKTDTFEDNAVFAVLVGRETLIRRIKLTENGRTVILIAEGENTEYTEYSGENINKLCILGKVISFQSRL